MIDSAKHEFTRLSETIEKIFWSRAFWLTIDMKGDGLSRTEPALDGVSPRIPWMMDMSSHDRPIASTDVASRNG